MPSFRVIQMTKSGKYRVQKKVGFPFRKWEYLNHSTSRDSLPAEFDTSLEATSFMEIAHAGSKPPPPEFTVVCWIREKE